MGEIRIKSGNLYPIAIGEDRFARNAGGTYQNNNGELIVETTTSKPSGVYSTAGSKLIKVCDILEHGAWSIDIKADTPFTAEVGFDSARKTVQLTDEYQRFSFDDEYFVPNKAFVFYNKTGVAHTIYAKNFMLNLGSTALPYQPYFLNRPAHQFTNGQFVDIPTHHYTNSRWQGELTSQSPLKFWADGEMLDWRVEGKTSENLWDGTFINTSDWGVSFSLDDAGYMVASSSSNDPREWGYAASQIKMTLSAGTYALVLQGIPPTQSWSGAMIYTSGGSALANNQNLVNKPLIIMPFTLAQETSIGIMVKVVNGKYRVQLLEGTYTTSTIPPYEPYGGVGDWDETTQRYKIPVRVEGANLFDGEWKQGTILSPSSANRVSNKNAISLKTNTVYTIGVRGSSVIQYALVYRDRDGKVTYDSGWSSMTHPVFSPTAEGTTAEIIIRRSDAGSITPVSEEILNLKVIFIEGRYTSSTIPLYEVNIYTDHQLMDGDSIDFATTETQIPLTTGNNTLSVDTAVQPSKVFVKFLG